MRPPEGVSGFSFRGSNIDLSRGYIDVFPDQVDELRSHSFTVDGGDEALDRAGLLAKFAIAARNCAETWPDEGLRLVMGLNFEAHRALFDGLLKVAALGAAPPTVVGPADGAAEEPAAVVEPTPPAAVGPVPDDSTAPAGAGPASAPDTFSTMERAELFAFLKERGVSAHSATGTETLRAIAREHAAQVGGG